MTHQQQNLIAEASAKRQRGKREISVDASSSNPSASASHNSLSSKDFKMQSIDFCAVWTPSGFAIFSMLEEDLKLPDAMQRIPCLFDDVVMEVMWGLKNLMHFLVPQEKMKLRSADRLPMSQGLKMTLNRHGFDVKPELPLRLAGEHIKFCSGIISEGWDLMKLATAVKIICYPAEATITEKEVNKGICLNVYNEMVEARTCIRSVHRTLESMPEMHQPIQ
ncbi:hypothetical protein HU200_011353 [Digitaria exilis]|uniref:Uncharacterized protein n=1 Tax=Digitaria exilis TaxID=1010633 RepID=A0A835FFZ1_9POAL|nr:hypothetical protein HU200_011353 [Digitaria exilis]